MEWCVEDAGLGVAALWVQERLWGWEGALEAGQVHRAVLREESGRVRHPLLSFGLVNTRN